MVGKYTPIIERGTTGIGIRYKGNKVSFVFPSQGPNNYQKVGKGILARNLKTPTGDHSALLLHAIYCSNKQNEQELREIREKFMKSGWFWVFNRYLWTQRGVYVVHDPEAKGLSEYLNVRNVRDLHKSLKGGKEVSWCGVRFSPDEIIRFAPEDSYRLGAHTPESLAKDGFVVASYGVDGAERLGEVSASQYFKLKPKTKGITFGEGLFHDPVQSVASLHYGKDFGGRLYVDGVNCWGYDHSGYAFGVSDKL